MLFMPRLFIYLFIYFDILGRVTYGVSTNVFRNLHARHWNDHDVIQKHVDLLLLECIMLVSQPYGTRAGIGQQQKELTNDDSCCFTARGLTVTCQSIGLHMADFASKPFVC